jgi:DNA repair protein RadC
MGTRSFSQAGCQVDLARQADDRLIADAIVVLEQRARYGTQEFTSPQATKDYFRLRLGGLEHEVFAVVYLDSQHRLIECEELFRGTLTQTSVYPREVIKSALRLNAASVVFAHNHPSGVTLPSRADEHLTTTLKQALALVDVRVLDHVVVSATEATSFSERGLL